MQLIFPTSGRAEILGRPVGDVSMRRRIGYLPENPYFYDYLTAEELLTYFAQLLGVPARRPAPAGEHAARPRRHRSRTPLPAAQVLEGDDSARRDRPGADQRAGGDLSRRADVGLDPLGRRDVRALILELRDQGRTVFFSSHILGDAEALCSRVAVVAGGRLAAHRTARRARRVRGPRLGTGGCRAAAGGARRGASRRHADRRDRRRPLQPRAAADAIARTADAGAGGGGCVDHLAQSRPRHARGLLHAARRRGRRRRARHGGVSGAGDRTHRAQRVSRVGARPGALQPRAVRRPADRLVLPANPSHRRPGHQDHQGSRACGHVALRPVHRRLHRHRPGLERGGAAQHLCAAGQADQPHAVRRRQVRGAGAHARRQRGGDGGGALRRARLYDVDRNA